jgi:hypothetical protein
MSNVLVFAALSAIELSPTASVDRLTSSALALLSDDVIASETSIRVKLTQTIEKCLNP